MTINEVFIIYFEKIKYVKHMLSYECQKTPERKTCWKNYVQGIISACDSFLFKTEDYFNIGDEGSPYIVKATRRKKDKYGYYVEGEYTDYEEAMNWHCYGIKVKAGEHYKRFEKPIYFIKLANELFPVFDDDPGQCVYIRLEDGQTFSCSSFSFCPNLELITELLNVYARKELPELY